MIRQNNKTVGQKFASRVKSSLMEDRLQKLEEKVFKLGKTPSTRSQQMLLLHHLGLLDVINKLNISNKKKALLLSSILNSSQDNIETDLSTILKKDSPIKTTGNYAYLSKIFEDSGLPDLVNKMETEFNRLENQSDKKSSK